MLGTGAFCAGNVIRHDLSGNAAIPTAAAQVFTTFQAAPGDGDALGEIHAESWKAAYAPFFTREFFDGAVRQRRGKWHGVIAEAKDTVMRRVDELYGRLPEVQPEAFCVTDSQFRYRTGTKESLPARSAKPHADGKLEGIRWRKSISRPSGPMERSRYGT